ncbi:MAG: ABC transporter substrate-binding protein, partial [gamma proteobacterium symbiont of Ctena orbiculata]
MIRLPAALLFALLFTFSLTANANVTPSERIKETVDQVLTVLKDQSLGRQDRRDQVKEIVRRRFDYESMSQVILAANWRTATKPQREQFIT